MDTHKLSDEYFSGKRDAESYYRELKKGITAEVKAAEKGTALLRKAARSERRSRVPPPRRCE